MKITQKQLKQIIKEETDAVLSEQERGFFRKLFRMQNPTHEKNLEAYERAIKSIKRRHANLQDTGTDEAYEAMIQDLDMATKAFRDSKIDTGYDANKDQRQLEKELDRNAKNLRDSIEQTSEEAYDANKRARQRQEDEDYAANRRREKERQAARERSRYAYRPQASSSKRGSAYDKFGKRYQDRNVIDITRLEETIASTISELLPSKEN